MPDDNWIAGVETVSVNEGPPGTLGSDKEPYEMALVLMLYNQDVSKGAILRYMQFVINRAGYRMDEQHRAKIKSAMEIIRRSL
jgi:hypothetical protein